MIASNERVWQRMLSGRRLDLADPSPLDVELEDIAHGLARVARWNGQTRGGHIFSVAQHTLLVDDLMVAASPAVPAKLRLAGLLHDAAEYVIGDLISPFKALLGERYTAIEERLLVAIHMRFGLAYPLASKDAAAIKAADRVSAYHEAVVLAGFDTKEAARFFGKPTGAQLEAAMLEPWPTPDAEQRYLDRFRSVESLCEDIER